ncbi:hypothetical protein GCM10023082_06390 [Streptomyces tremellae]|uniref:Uncharacterized protein n=1 Tax=Streptomyces tremellae TaxID=1124239 RepID=A0ABP7DYT5_9ACTN
MRFLTVTGPAGIHGWAGESSGEQPPTPTAGLRSCPRRTLGTEMSKNVLDAFGSHHQADPRLHVTQGSGQPPQKLHPSDP